MKTLKFTNQQRVVFCSDIHLHHSLEHVDILVFFLQQLIQWTHHYDAVFILGDWFEYWLDATCIQRFHYFFQKLKQNKGYAKLYYMPGNRDFLIQQASFSPLDITIIPDPCLLTTETERVLLTHGDMFCSSDYGYLLLRALLRNPITLRIAQRIPNATKCKIAQFLRTTSKARTACKPRHRMQTEDHTMMRWANTTACTHIVHGHVHAASERILYNTTRQTPTFIHVHVLDAWEHQANALYLHQRIIQFMPIEKSLMS